jgi:hypothetical protein
MHVSVPQSKVKKVFLLLFVHKKQCFLPVNNRLARRPRAAGAV